MLAVLSPETAPRRLKRWIGLTQGHAMRFSSFSKFEGTDFVAFAACGVIGYLLGTLAPEGSALAIYSTVLISYHLFLAWLVLFSGGEHKEAGVSLPLGHTVLTHLSCLFVILAPVAIARHAIPNFGGAQDNNTLEGMAATDHSIRVFQALCCSIAGFAMFERSWLFSSEAPMEKPRPVEMATAPVVLAATADDFEAWRQHLAQQKPGSQRAGASLKAEYEQWLLARQQSRAAQSANDGQLQ
jgi:hypothetical protein